MRGGDEKQLRRKADVATLLQRGMNDEAGVVRM
jgi:hypothetical protein